MNRRFKFTLVELLIVISVISVLLSLVQPALESFLENSRRMVCKNNLRNLSFLFFNFSEDNDNFLPGTVHDNENEDPLKRSWLGDEVGFRDGDPSKRMRFVRGKGTLYQYMNQEIDHSMFRCPSLELGTWNSGEGSNGLFDYISFLAFSGAKVHLLPSKSYYPTPLNDNVVNLDIHDMKSSVTPLLSEEDAFYWLNRENIEPSHGNLDRLGNWHDNGINVMAFDGSSQTIDFLYRGPFAREWKIISMGGEVHDLTGTSWGWLNDK